MRRDIELIRKMVLAIEEHPDGSATELQIDGYDSSQIGYHAYLLVESGLAVGSDVTTLESSGPEWIIGHLTTAGHDFAESARTEYVWDEVIEEMKRKGFVSASVDVVKRMLDKQLRKRLDSD